MSIIESIKDRVSMLDVLQMYGQHPVRGRNNYQCFVHNDKHPSAGITKTGTHFHCFSCLYTGNIFDVVMYFEKCDLKTSMQILDSKFNLGLYRQLSHKDKLEIAKQMKERERQKQEKLRWECYEKDVLADIIKNLRVYENCESMFRIKKGQYRDVWSNEYGDIYFYVLKQLMWLEWLYGVISGKQHYECVYDYIYPTNKRDLLAMIKSGEIFI